MSNFSNQDLFNEKCQNLFSFLKEKKLAEFDLSYIKEFDKEIEFDDASIILWIGAGKGFWKVSDDYRILLNSTE